MPISSELLSGRQYRTVAVTKIDASELTEATLEQVFELPPNAVVLTGTLKVTTVFDGTTPTLSVGLLSGTATDFLTTTAIAALSTTSFAALHVPTVAQDVVTITPVLGSSTVGAIVLVVEYVILGKADYNQ